ncbi:hypothetical protein OR1_00623 [Geobacter sp. OR-1]|uniref:hypothetical protein n=1 Tax=Geobacter sp. OR-1 TaxID=1266765 RepID=UPI00054195A7|nr:hypothetical protein [Geobacter sp. OR-1]GAM08352.1 hypothetical protein OR1_00623 [Geobacter sp. OR-1]
MNKTILVFSMFMSLVILEGCAGNKKLVNSMSFSTSQSVFQEINENASPVSGYVVLRIYSSFKTHKPGIYSIKDVHGTQEYTLLVNIDGQAITLRGRISEEKSGTRPMGDPEGGEGVRYIFEKKIRLKTGVHKLVIALPVDDLVAEREVDLPEGENNSLTVEPIYGAVPGKPRPGTYGLSSYKEGIKSFRLLLNGE